MWCDPCSENSSCVTSYLYKYYFCNIYPSLAWLQAAGVGICDPAIHLGARSEHVVKSARVNKINKIELAGCSFGRTPTAACHGPCAGAAARAVDGVHWRRADGTRRMRRDRCYVHQRSAPTPSASAPSGGAKSLLTTQRREWIVATAEMTTPRGSSLGVGWASSDIYSC